MVAQLAVKVEDFLRGSAVVAVEGEEVIVDGDTWRTWVTFLMA